MSSVAEAAERDTADAERMLRFAEPITRRDLANPSVVSAASRLAEAEPKVGNTPLGVVNILRSFEHGNFALYEVATALDFHGLLDAHDNTTSSAFLERLQRWAN